MDIKHADRLNKLVNALQKQYKKKFVKINYYKLYHQTYKGLKYGEKNSSPKNILHIKWPPQKILCEKVYSSITRDQFDDDIIRATYLIGQYYNNEVFFEHKTFSKNIEQMLEYREKLEKYLQSENAGQEASCKKILDKLVSGQTTEAEQEKIDELLGKIELNDRDYSPCILYVYPFSFKKGDISIPKFCEDFNNILFKKRNIALFDTKKSKPVTKDNPYPIVDVSRYSYPDTSSIIDTLYMNNNVESLILADLTLCFSLTNTIFVLSSEIIDNWEKYNNMKPIFEMIATLPCPSLRNKIATEVLSNIGIRDIVDLERYKHRLSSLIESCRYNFFFILSKTLDELRHHPDILRELREDIINSPYYYPLSDTDYNKQTRIPRNPWKADLLLDNFSSEIVTYNEYYNCQMTIEELKLNSDNDRRLQKQSDGGKFKRTKKGRHYDTFKAQTFYTYLHQDLMDAFLNANKGIWLDHNPDFSIRQ